MPRVVTLDLAASTLTTSGIGIADDGVESAPVFATLINTDGKPMAGLAAAHLSLTSNGSGNTITPVSTVTDRNGVFEWSFTSTVAATKTLTLTALGGAELEDNPTVVVGTDTTWEANLPASFTEKFDTLFGNLIEGTNADTILPQDNPSFAPNADRTDISGTDAGATWPPDVYQYTYPGNDAGNGVGVPYVRLESVPAETAAKQIYTCFDLFLSSGYVTHTTEEKLFYPISNGTAGNGVHQVSLYVPSGMTAYDAAAVGINVQSSTGTQRFTQSIAPYVEKNQWNRIEVLLKMNTVAGATDGVAQVWVNNTLVLNVSTICWRSSDSDGYWQYARMDSTRGGGASSVLTPAGGQTRKFSRWSYHYRNTL